MKIDAIKKIVICIASTRECINLNPLIAEHRVTIIIA